MFILPLVAGILLGALTVVFALQNVGEVTLTLFLWHTTAPLALVLMATLFCGIALALLSLAPGLIRDELHLRMVKKEKREVEDELAQHRFTKKRLPTGEETLHAQTA